MTELQIIYTPNAHDFIPSIFPNLVDRRPDNPVLQKLRDNYSTLEKRYGSLPQHVSVVTVDDIWKNNSQRYGDELVESDIAKITTTYLPLGHTRRMFKS